MAEGNISRQSKWKDSWTSIRFNVLSFMKITITKLNVVSFPFVWLLMVNLRHILGDNEMRGWVVKA
ncbi:MAG TPA: hypothetical protein DEG17_14020 [Cyanobacteria bacterium UBA11149]|nr:hypothetical protein [Cyanobacteria bacterium UBA11367]HBE56721.1 hypothetical protein [Cyanobacteria bacterium UBA11366]HBK63035.1 hypothetical protein [Cyanobacteria bacterium UBA11166]HBR75301.1 hypothetical protein [Cyanobacteria bacterium UBA11159]HBS71408.1 hypothetical protein [Cyanobacteria bacterium UBA11153]HBW89954.1 hypothetical protein [Cyanobacteria bacterium UBA11149]HCA98178.1 hypothetical protein [Cyanobacteria bacterium UBA9226]